MQKKFTRLSVELGDGLGKWIQEFARENNLTKVEIVRSAFAAYRAMGEEKLTADQREVLKSARKDEILKDIRILRGRSVSVARIL